MSERLRLQRTKKKRAKKKRKHNESEPASRPIDLHSTSPDNIMRLQSLIGNHAVMRVMTEEELRQKAGDPHKNKFFGLKKMSTKYKEFLASLRYYHNFLNSKTILDSLYGTDVTPDNLVTRVNQQLDILEEACDSYINTHANDQERTPHIREIRDQEIPQDRDAVQAAAQHPNLIQGRTVAEAIRFGQDANLIQQAVSAQAGAVGAPTSEEKEEAAATYQDYLDMSNDDLTEVIRQQVSSDGSQPFRGSDPLTLAGREASMKMGADYLTQTLLPTMQDIIIEFTAGQDMPTNVGDYNIRPEDALNESEAEMSRKLQEIVPLAYEAMLESLLGIDGNGVIPDDIISAAADTYNRVYATVSDDPNAEHSAAHAARVSVVNMIFLRFINGQITAIAGRLGDNPAAARFIARLGQILQAHVNGIDVFANQPVMALVDEDQQERMTGMIQAVIDGVIALASARAKEAVRD